MVRTKDITRQKEIQTLFPDFKFKRIKEVTKDCVRHVNIG